VDSQKRDTGKMTVRLTARLIIDFVMMVLMLFSLSYRITGDVSHEWTGVSLSVLFVVHNIINYRWYRQMFKGRYDFKRCLNTAVNLLLLAAMSILISTGLLHSRTVPHHSRLLGPAVDCRTSWFALGNDYQRYA
jgi:hypothetical protein